MHRAFNLKNCSFDGVEMRPGFARFARDQLVAGAVLGEFLDEKKIDGSKMQEQWFPQLHADVFISHSHDDQKDAIKLAGWLKTHFGLSSFIDSCVWGHADKLLKQIDNEHCWQRESRTYNYNSRNGSTSHVHMMLSTALANMIYSTECVIFLNTPNSITSEGSVQKTQSPWLYYELGMIHTTWRRSASEHRPKELSESFSKKGTLPPIEYQAELKGLTGLTASDLTSWRDEWMANDDEDVHPLDLLYEAVPES